MFIQNVRRNPYDWNINCKKAVISSNKFVLGEVRHYLITVPLISLWTFGLDRCMLLLQLTHIRKEKKLCVRLILNFAAFDDKV